VGARADGGGALSRRTLARSRLAGPVVGVARDLLGRLVESRSPEGTVAVRLTEVEAYDGANDPASHAYRGRTGRNEVMFGPPGHLYVYFVYGMHWCCNVVCGVEGVASAVLLRAGAVVSGTDLARRRRPAARADVDLARGPARLAAVLGVDRRANGVDLCDPRSPIRLLSGEAVADGAVRSGPRVGVATAGDVPWRFWVAADPTVSPYRIGGTRRRTRSAAATAAPAATFGTDAPPAGPRH
jgi:DNA-3-methyladenine glycosylase